MRERKKWKLWLTIRLLRKQKLRTAAVVCGMLFSGFLLTAFGSLGHDFWRQVHGETGGAAEFDSTQKILIVLIWVLLILITSCAGILLRNLFSLTFPQRQRSLSRLISLGADLRDMIHMEIMEILLLYGIAAPSGCALAIVLGNKMGIRHGTPLWIIGGGMLWIFLVSCICGIRPLSAAFRGQEGKKICRKRRKACGKTVRLRPGFLWYMAGKYRQADRGHDLRIAVSVVAAILLYVPAGYLIDTNISVQQAGLYAKYGIQYDCTPQNREELERALRELGRLAESREGGTMVCVSLDTRAHIKTDAVSDELRNALREAGWDENGGDESPVLTVDASILFVDDSTFAKCLQTAGNTESAIQDMTNPSTPVILVNRYTNRKCWSEKADVFFRETSLLADGEDGSSVEVYYDFGGEFEPDSTKYIVPDMIINEIPEGIYFTGNLSLILPQSSMNQICPSDIRHGMFQVCGKFEDGSDGEGERIFCGLEKRLGKNALGRLTYTRRTLWEWYDSMEGIHRAMNAICLTLFFIAVLNMFSMILFQYMERQKGLAILWSAGQGPGGLFQLLVMENITPLLSGVLTGIPLAAFLCYYIYGIFRQAWQVTFTLPIRQIVLISISVLAVSAAAFLLDGILLRRQNFLAHIKEIT